MSSTRNIVQDWWDALPPEQRARFDGAFGPELNKQVAEAQETIAKIEAKYAAPVLTEDVSNLPVHQGPLVTIFLDGLIKRPMGESTLMLTCDWCDAKTPDRSDSDFAIEDGWRWIGAGDDSNDDIICPACAKELPE